MTRRRSRLLSALVGLTMVFGSLVATSGTAHAISGRLEVSGPIGFGSIPPLIMTAIGGGTFSGSSWSGHLKGSGSIACITVTMNTPDAITWDGADTGTQTMTNAAFTFMCGSDACRVVLNGNRVLQTTVGGFPVVTIGSVNHRQGTFTTAPGTQLGSVTISNAGGACFPNLGALIFSSFGCPPPSGPTTCNSTAPFTASLYKDLEL